MQRRSGPKERAQGIDADRVARLLAWYERHGRRFLWREGADDYGLVVAEILLRKTRADAVVPAYNEFAGGSPTPEALRRASVAEIRGLVRHLGLGVQRSDQLKQAAADLVAREDVPTYETRAIAGIGDYGAAAIDVVARGDA